MTLNLFNTPTDNLNNEMDEEVEENANTNKIKNQSGDETMETHT